MQQARFFGWATGKDLFNGANAVVVLKKGADANKRVLHGRVEAFERVGGEETGVWIKQLSHRIDEGLLDFGSFAIDDVGKITLVAAADLFACSVERLDHKLGVFEEALNLGRIKAVVVLIFNVVRILCFTVLELFFLFFAGE